VYNRKFEIIRVDNIGPPVNRTLATKYGLLSKVYPQQSMRDALIQLRKYA